MKRQALSVFLCAVIALMIIACCPKDPVLYSVKTAHGNTDWHIDTAEEFLTGEDMNGDPTAENHCPDTWTKTHMHVGLTNTNVYYYDKDVTPSGQDNHLVNGIDRPMLFFYAGHGCPTHFDTLSNDAYLTNMRLGNCVGANDGTLRYYWQCSCQVFAHGPKQEADYLGEGEYDYPSPQDFDGSPDSVDMRNVYERWGPILHPNLRMACGSSTAAYCHEDETNRIWDNYNNMGFYVSDSFIFGLHRVSWNTPLCITTGGLSVSGTPLFDHEFTNAPNPSGDYFHIQYLLNFDSNAPLIIPFHPPEQFHTYELDLPPLPDPYQKLKFETKGEWMYSINKVGNRGSAVKVNLNSGAVYAFGERKFNERVKPLKEEEYIQLANRFIKEQGWAEKEISEPIGARMIIDRMPINGKPEDLKRFQKNVVVTFKRQISINNGKAVNFIGAGGTISIQMNNDGSLLNASKVWRKIKKIKKTTKSKKYEEAYREAIAGIKEKDAYKLINWTWGYKEASGNVKQTELKAVYIFNFYAADPKKSMDYPPLSIEISAHLE